MKPRGCCIDAFGQGVSLVSTYAAYNTLVKGPNAFHGHHREQFLAIPINCSEVKQKGVVGRAEAAEAGICRTRLGAHTTLQ